MYITTLNPGPKGKMICPKFCEFVTHRQNICNVGSFSIRCVVVLKVQLMVQVMGRPIETKFSDGFNVSDGRPKGSSLIAGFNASDGRPKGTTTDAGFNASDGHPKGTTLDAGYNALDGHPLGATIDGGF